MRISVRLRNMFSETKAKVAISIAIIAKTPAGTTMRNTVTVAIVIAIAKMIANAMTAAKTVVIAAATTNNFYKSTGCRRTARFC